MADRRSDQRLFEQLNERFFWGRLPQYRVRRINPRCSGWGGECDAGARTISLARYLSGEAARQVLLHEMCHVGTPGHGKRFQVKLQRLARLGESWAAEEARMYQDTLTMSTSPTAQIRRVISDLALEHPTISWHQARLIVSNEIGRTPHDLVHIAPWAESVWRRDAAEQRHHRRNRVVQR